MMRGKIAGVLLVVLIIVFVIFALTTSPNIDESADEAGRQSETFDPMAVPMLVHMQEAEAVRFGNDPDSQVRVKKIEDGKISVYISDELIDLLGQDTLARLEIPDQEVNLSQDGYVQFVNRLHDLVAQAFPEKHTAGMHDQDHENEDEHYDDHHHE